MATLISLEPGFAPEGFSDARMPTFDGANIYMVLNSLSLSGGADPEPPGQVVPFEMKTADQRFLAEAQQFLDLSPLDRCQHQVRACIQS